jgi:hypothetical protein
MRRNRPFSSKSFCGLSDGFAARITLSVSILGYASIAGSTYPHSYPHGALAIPRQ